MTRLPILARFHCPYCPRVLDIRSSLGFRIGYCGHLRNCLGPKIGYFPPRELRSEIAAATAARFFARQAVRFGSTATV